MWLERLVGREQNDSERGKIIEAAAREAAEAVFFLGDLVAVGSLPSDWEKFDQLIRPLREKKIPLLSVYGNHDYFYHSKRAQTLMTTRFPNLKDSPWGVRHFGELAVVYLDSNKQALSSADWTRQLEWLRTTLQEIDEDPKLRGCLLVLHHPPYTNSLRSRASRAVRDEITPLFLAAKKSIALISGHCHAYERFEIEGRTFLVSGGAGGPRVRILPKKWHRLPDLFNNSATSDAKFRPFHFIRIDANNTGLSFNVIGLDKGESKVKMLDSFQLGFRD